MDYKAIYDIEPNTDKSVKFVFCYLFCIGIDKKEYAQYPQAAGFLFCFHHPAAYSSKSLDFIPQDCYCFLHILFFLFLLNSQLYLVFV